MKPYFSVLIPTYNREQHIRQSVDSVLAQTWNDFELFVIDDGSTDGTQDALAQYGSRIHVIEQENQGPEVARNRAALQARGDYLVFLDSDDLLFPRALETYARVIQACDSPPLIIGSMTYFLDGNLPRLDEKSGSEIKVMRFPDYLSKDVSVDLSNSEIVIRKSSFEEIGGLRKTSSTTFHLDDINLILKAGAQSPCVVLLEPKTVAYRAHATNSIRNPKAMVDGILSIIASEKKGEYPGGRERRWDRRACIGGISQRWIYISLKVWKPGQALRLFFKSVPMLAAIACKRIHLKLRRKTPPFVVGKDINLRMQ